MTNAKKDEREVTRPAFPNFFSTIAWIPLALRNVRNLLIDH